MSFPLTFSQEEIDLYRAFQKEMNWYEAQIKTSPSSEDNVRLSKDRDRLLSQLAVALAE